MADWLPLMWSYIQLERVDQYAWKAVGGKEITPSGMLAAAHLLGARSLAAYIKSDGKADLRDPYGTPIADYIERLNGYDMPFMPRQVAFN